MELHEAGVFVHSLSLQRNYYLVMDGTVCMNKRNSSNMVL